MAVQLASDRVFPFIEFGLNPGPQFAGGLAGEGQRQNFFRFLNLGQQGQIPFQENGGLAGAGRGLNVDTEARINGLMALRVDLREVSRSFFGFSLVCP